MSDRVIHIDEFNDPPVYGIIGGLFVDDEPFSSKSYRFRIINDHGSTEYWIDDRQIFPPDNIYWELDWTVSELPQWVKNALENTGCQTTIE